jgi:hypothetical protein
MKRARAMPSRELLVVRQGGHDMGSHAMVNVFAAGILTWVALAAHSPAVEAMRGPWVHTSEAGESSNPPALSTPHSLQVQSGAALQVRLNRSLSTSQNRPGDPFTGTLVEPVEVDGQTVLHKGAQVTGLVEESAPSGRFKGQAHLMLSLSSIQVDGHALGLSTSVKARNGRRHRKHNTLWVGGGSGTGALIGALAGGPVGMVVGAGTGAAAGLAGAFVTSRKQVSLPAETLLTFRLRIPLDVPASYEPLPSQAKATDLHRSS